MKIYKQYAKEILEQLNYVPTWLPTVKLVPGDVCDMRGYELRHVSHLNEFDISFDLIEKSIESDIEYSSEGAVSIQFKIDGDIPPTGSTLKVEEAGISLTLARKNAILLKMADCSMKRIRSPHAIGEKILKLHNAGKWPEGYVVVMETVLAGASTIIISNGSDAGIDLVTNGSVSQGPMTLVSLDAGLRVKRESKIGAKFISMPGLTPLAKTSGIQKRFIRPDRFKSTGNQQDFIFKSVDYSDY
ncbi:MAG: hypothetical protein WBG90_10140 [Saonia sp.]